MKRWQKYTILTLAWLGVVAYIIFAASSVRAHRSKLVVENIDIEIVDSSAVANLVSQSMVRKWIKESKIPVGGQRVDSVRFNDLEKYISENGFIDEVKCFTTHRGELKIEVSQLTPVLRIMIDGHNSYVTADGDIFARPLASSRYTPVVTGDYTPLFRPGYTGSIHELFEAQKEELEEEIRRIEIKEIYPLYANRVKIREALRKVNRRYISKKFNESKKEFAQKVKELKERNAKERAELQRENYHNDMEIARRQRAQKVYRAREKKLEKKYKDFINLLIFVNVVENDKFWRSEIVQIVANESTDSDLRLELIPRSGNHTIIFGNPYDAEERLESVKTFYKRVLPNEGWQKFKSINVEYKNQVVCK